MNLNAIELTRDTADVMKKTVAPKKPALIEELLNHIQERTFGRLHELAIAHEPEGRICVSAIAHSRFVGQLAEWAVLEIVNPDQVDLDIHVRRPSQHLIEVEK